MPITCDWHIHTTHSCDCGPRNMGVPMAALAEQARAQGVADLGVTDHLHTAYNLKDIFDSREEFDALPFDARMHFGIEVSCVSKWEIDEIESGRRPATTYGLREGGPAGGPLAIGLSAEDVREYGIEYVVGGVHWPLFVPLERQAVIRDYHRQNLFLATHPLVRIVAHPWWWHGHWQDAQGRFAAEPWLDDFGVIPRSMHDEFAAACIEHGKAVEVNLGACLMNPTYPASFAPRYIEYLAGLKSRGVTLALGSDTHGPRYPDDLAAVARLLDPLDLHEADLWRLPPRPPPPAPQPWRRK